MRNLSLSILLGVLTTVAPGWSQSAPQNSSIGGTTVQRSSISLEAALAVAQAGLKAGKAKGSDVAACVVDDHGLPLVLLRADRATEQFVSGAASKAWTAVNFGASTRDLFESVKEGKEDNSQLPHAEKALFLMGGIPLKVGTTVVGGVGVAGCPRGLDDDAAAQAAAETFAAMIGK